ncbi:MAG: alkaline phosphatase family protein [SAR202 cluster bacterium]|jgi:arylsulfatase A-like enzyme|nr:alkaline phosphatase family protein [SAR202 cluster bacterium]
MKVLVVSFDGLQPSQINEDLMPNLYGYLNEGVIFTNHHAVYPSVTRINSTSMFSGRYPGSHGIAANTVMMRDFDPSLVFSVMQPDLENVREKLGEVLYVKNLGDILNDFGEKFVAIGAGTTGNSFLQNPNAHRNGGAVVNPEFTLPYSLGRKLDSMFGDWPEEDIPNEKRLKRCVDVMTKYFIPEINPLVGLIWFSEPDKSHHADGVGYEIGNQAIKYADAYFADLVNDVRKNENSKDTDIIIISDHGYSTIQGVIDIKRELIKVGLLDNEHDKKILIAPNGGTVLFYVENSNITLATKLARALMKFDWCGPMFCSSNVGNIEGLLPAELIGIEGSRCPDITMSFQWNSEKNKAGYKGMIYSSSGDVGLGTHGSISKHEMNNVFGAFGPSFKKGLVCCTPTGNVDLTPTIMQLIGLKTDTPFDGRPIFEALSNGIDPEHIKVNTEEFTSEYADNGEIFQQKLVMSSIGNTQYIDYAERNLFST